MRPSPHLGRKIIGFSFGGMTGVFWQRFTVCHGATIFDK
jgi:hypothetical protein